MDAVTYSLTPGLFIFVSVVTALSPSAALTCYGSFRDRSQPTSRYPICDQFCVGQQDASVK